MAKKLQAPRNAGRDADCCSKAAFKMSMFRPILNRIWQGTSPCAAKRKRWTVTFWNGPGKSPIKNTAQQAGCGGDKNRAFHQRVALTIAGAPFYSALVEATASSAFAPTIPNGPLTRVTEVVRRDLGEVESQIISRTESFDPPVEGHIRYGLAS